MDALQECVPIDPEQLGPAAAYRHDHPPVRNINAEYDKKVKLGQRIADNVATLIGSWPFIITQSFFLVLWMSANAYLAVMIKVHPGYLKAWDPYPFILLNLVLSFQAAYTGPVVMMSQNRQNFKDRLMAEHDFEINRRAEEEIKVVMEHLTHQDKLLLAAVDRVEAAKSAILQEETLQKLGAVLKQMEEKDRHMTEMIERMQGSLGKQ